MSELIQGNESSNFRWKLLAEVSALALMSYVVTMPVVMAGDIDRPTVWVELGGQLSKWQSSQESYAPPFVALTPSNFSPPQKAEALPGYGMDESAALIFQPEGSDWTFSAALRYGRADGSKHIRQQTNPVPFSAYLKIHRIRNGVVRDILRYDPVYANAARYADTAANHNQNHTILDFQAGKDLGIGLFGQSGNSSLNFGVRFAQFVSKSQIKLRENPDWQFKTLITTYSRTNNYYGYYLFHRTWQHAYQPYHQFAGSFLASRSFNGLGPSIAWNSSQRLVGRSDRGELTFDWAVNAALLFGRQKAKVHHQTTAHFHSSHAAPTQLPISYQRIPVNLERSRGVVVPNIGALAGFSVKYPNVKVSFGYRADFFFGAMDGGIDVRRTEDIGFHGLYASVSIGLGG